MILGNTLNGNKPIGISKNAFNDSILLTGLSGSGKTWKVRKLEKRLVESGEYVLVLDYHGTHQRLNLGEEESLVRRVNVYEKGIPLGILNPLRLPNSYFENPEDVANEVVKIFSYISGGLGSLQAATMRRAAVRASEIRTRFSNDLRAIDFALQEMENDDPSATGLRERFWAFFHYGNCHAGSNFLEPGQINVYDLNSYDAETQRILAEFILCMVWRYLSRYGQMSRNNIYVICDEFQTFNLGKRGILSQILREGRKFHIGLILATQTISGFSKETRAVLEQCATKMYFRTTPAEALRQGADLDAGNRKFMSDSLLRLKRGQCIASGILSSANGSDILKPLILAAEN